MLTASALETKGGNWEPVVVHQERLDPYRNECFPYKLRRTKQDAISYSEKIIRGRELSILYRAFFEVLWYRIFGR